MQVSDAAPSVPSPATVADKAQDAAKANFFPREPQERLPVLSWNLTSEPCMQVSDAAPNVPSPAKVADQAQDAAKAIPSPSETASAVTRCKSRIGAPDSIDLHAGVRRCTQHAPARWLTQDAGKANSPSEPQ